MIEDLIEDHGNTVTFEIEVVPNSKAFSITWDEWRNKIKMKIRSKAQKGRANQEIVDFFKETGDARILRGSLSKDKLVEVAASKPKVILHISRFME